MSDKDFKVKNKLVVNGLTGGAGPLIANSNKEIDSVAFLTTLQGGTGTTTSPSAGQVLYSAGGTSYNPTAINTLDVKGASYSADAPSNPVVGQVWIESDSSSDSFDPNIIRRKSFTATAAQTVFTTDLEFIQGYEQVFFNGMLLLRNSDYTTASNTNVTLASGAAVGDIVEIVSITNLNSINAATTTTNTFTGDQYIAGNVGIGITTPNNLLHIYNATNSTVFTEGDATTFNIISRNSSDNGSAALVFRKARGTAASKTAISNGDFVGNIIFGGYDGASNLAAATINGASDGTISTGVIPGRITFNTANSSGVNTERIRIDSSGQVGIGGVASASTLRIGKAITGAVSAYGVISNGAIQSDVTSNAFSFVSAVSTTAAAFTLAAQYGFYAGGTAIGAGSTITNQIGFAVASSHNTGTNNFGFSSAIATSGLNNYNFYAGGTAPNYFAGRTGIGATLTSAAMAQVTNTTAADIALVVKGAASQTGDLLQVQNSAGTVLTSITSAGVLNSLFVTNAQVASYTLVLADAGKLVEISNASANNLTVPLNASVAYPVGTQINIVQSGLGQTSVVATGGVTINSTPGLKLRAQWSSATLIKRAENTWLLVGDLSA